MRRPRRRPSGRSSWQVWGAILIAPYVLVFLLFVLYPVGYGFWLARDPHNYVELFDDPIFVRAIGNTLVFLLVGVNLKMLVALALSGFFTAEPLVDPRPVAALHPALGRAVDPDDPVVPLHAQPRVGHRQPGHLPADRRRTARTGSTTPSLALSFAILVHIWKSLPFWTLILISGRLAISQRPLRGRLGRRRDAAGSSSASSPGRRCGPSI